ncbi:MAG: hypothetical protein R3C62_05650 [Chloroflexota bacterium]
MERDESGWLWALGSARQMLRIFNESIGGWGKGVNQTKTAVLQNGRFFT